MQCDVVCCSVLQCVAMHLLAIDDVTPDNAELYYSVLQRVAVCCRVLQCVTVCCSVLQ